MQKSPISAVTKNKLPRICGRIEENKDQSRDEIPKKTLNISVKSRLNMFAKLFEAYSYISDEIFPVS